MISHSFSEEPSLACSKQVPSLKLFIIFTWVLQRASLNCGTGWWEHQTGKPWYFKVKPFRESLKSIRWQLWQPFEVETVYIVWIRTGIYMLVTTDTPGRSRGYPPHYGYHLAIISWRNRRNPVGIKICQPRTTMPYVSYVDCVACHQNFHAPITSFSTT